MCVAVGPLCSRKSEGDEVVARVEEREGDRGARGRRGYGDLASGEHCQQLAAAATVMGSAGVTVKAPSTAASSAVSVSVEKATSANGNGTFSRPGPLPPTLLAHGPPCPFSAEEAGRRRRGRCGWRRVLCDHSVPALRATPGPLRAPQDLMSGPRVCRSKGLWA